MNVNKSVEGDYLVKLYSVLEENKISLQKNIKVYVHEPLKWISVSNSKVVQVGSNVTFTCLPNSNLSTISWSKNGIPIKSKKFKIGSYYFVLL